MTTRIVIEIETGKEKIAVYAPNRIGNKQFNVDGKFYRDIEFDKKFIIPITESDNNRGLGLSDNSNVDDNGHEDY